MLLLFLVLRQNKGTFDPEQLHSSRLWVKSEAAQRFAHEKVQASRQTVDLYSPLNPCPAENVTAV
jgi:hypothetical protein